MLASARSVQAFSCAPRRTCLLVECAHKKGAGSTKNGRDSNAKRRGVKVYGGQPVKAGGIIVRQTGTTWYDGDNTALGKDNTLYSLIDGIVIFQKKETKSKINVYPMEHEKAVAAVTVCHTKQPKEGVPSRKERRKTMYTPRAQQRGEQAAAMAAVVAAPKP